MEKYKVTVTSWENDGDNYRTESIIVDSKEEAEMIKHLCDNVFCSSNSRKKGIGNLGDDEYEEAKQVILNYLKHHPGILKGKKMSPDQQFNYIMNLNSELMGESEWYCSRVCEKCKIEVDIAKGRDIHVIQDNDGQVLMVTADLKKAKEYRDSVNGNMTTTTIQ